MEAKGEASCHGVGKGPVSMDFLGNMETDNHLGIQEGGKDGGVRGPTLRELRNMDLLEVRQALPTDINHLAAAAVLPLSRKFERIMNPKGYTARCVLFSRTSRYLSAMIWRLYNRTQMC